MKTLTVSAENVLSFALRNVLAGMFDYFSATCFVFVVKMSLSECGYPALDDVSMSVSGFLEGNSSGDSVTPFDHKLAL